MSSAAVLPHSAVAELRSVAVRRPPRLSVIIPTFNEIGNMDDIVQRLHRALHGIDWEAIFVDDDSPDGTSAAAKVLAANDTRIRCMRRVGRRGLSGACIDGLLSSSAPFIAVMDGDCQHDEAILPEMFRTLEGGGADLIVGSRYILGGEAAFDKAGRSNISRGANAIAQRALGIGLSDPMSGFFMMRRDRFEAIADRLSPLGFKILLDIVTTARDLRIVEVPYSFRHRQAGESKFDLQSILMFFGLLFSKLSGGLLDQRFVTYALVGTTGLGVHLLALLLTMSVLMIPFAGSQAIATVIAIGSNFILNNALTYRDRRLGGLAMLTGAVRFAGISAVGALANVGVAAWLYSEEPVWWAAGAAGAVMGALWNYLLSSQLVWRTR